MTSSKKKNGKRSFQDLLMNLQPAIHHGHVHVHEHTNSYFDIVLSKDLSEEVIHKLATHIEDHYAVTTSRYGNFLLAVTNQKALR